MKNAEMATMGNIANIKLYDIFRKDLRLPEKKAQDLVVALDETIREGHENILQGLATKEFVKDEIHSVREFVKDEIHCVKEEIFATKQLLKEEIHSVREFVKDEIISTKKEIFVSRELLKDEIHQTKDEMTKVIFKYGLIQLLTILGAVFAIIKFMLAK